MAASCGCFSVCRGWGKGKANQRLCLSHALWTRLWHRKHLCRKPSKEDGRRMHSCKVLTEQGFLREKHILRIRAVYEENPEGAFLMDRTAGQAVGVLRKQAGGSGMDQAGEYRPSGDVPQHDKMVHFQRHEYPGRQAPAGPERLHVALISHKNYPFYPWKRVVPKPEVYATINNMANLRSICC